ncbi:hypothetical protein DPMN_023756 [Dreissena polymorpha]|uniref:Uncharacterized protein n=1 Tax=Dreissena polymorpha TaxID=45954 RepID=A0A9D4RB06_DREPO|nr:hypothetical protein DPMN_023756 [Dreissena polymorpha]
METLHVAVQEGDCNIRDINGDTPTCDIQVGLVPDCNIGDSNGVTPTCGCTGRGLQYKGHQWGHSCM